MSGTKAESSFEELLKSLADVSDDTEALGKKAPAPDDKLIADAEEDGESDEELEDEQGEEFGKSLGSDADGNDLVDATDLVKSIMARQDVSEGMLTKALTSIAGVMNKQNDLIKSLQADVKTMSAQGRGRKTLMAISEKPGVSDTLAKSEGGDGDGAITPADLLVKSNAAYTAGKLSGAELNTVDVCLRNHWPIDAGILRKVAAA